MKLKDSLKTNNYKHAVLVLIVVWLAKIMHIIVPVAVQFKNYFYKIILVSILHLVKVDIMPIRQPKNVKNVNLIY
jgi:hypothetical protein